MRAGTRPPRTPWFRRRPGLALAACAGLFAAVLAARFAVADPTEPVTAFFALPVALLAVTRGRSGGLAGGGLGAALLVLWAAVAGARLPAITWVAGTLPLLLLGVLLGHATDGQRRAEAERLRLEAAAQRHHDAVEINDSLVQSLTTAKWSLEAGDVDRGLQIITETSSRAITLVSDLLHDTEHARTARPPSR